MKTNKSNIDVEHIAHLASIRLTDDEKNLFENQLRQVLDYVNQLEEVNVDDVIDNFSATSDLDHLAQDIVGDSLSHEQVVNNAPHSKNGEIQVPKIIDQ